MKKYQFILGIVVIISALLICIRVLPETEKSQKKESITENTRTIPRMNREDFRENAIVKRNASKNVEEEWTSYWLREKRPTRIQVADFDMPLVFEDQTLSEEFKQVILADIHLVYGHSSGHTIYDAQKQLSYKDKSFQSSNWVSFDGIGVRRPKEFSENSDTIININGIDHLFVTIELSDSYRQAWTLRNANKNIYRELEEFLQEANLSTRENPIDRTPDDLMWTPQKNIPQPSEIPNIVQTFSHESMRSPSLLEIKENTTPLSDEEPIFSAKAYFFKDDTNIPQTEIILVYHKGLWKFVYAQLGT